MIRPALIVVCCIPQLWTDLSLWLFYVPLYPRDIRTNPWFFSTSPWISCQKTKTNKNSKKQKRQLSRILDQKNKHQFCHFIGSSSPAQLFRPPCEWKTASAPRCRAEERRSRGKRWTARPVITGSTWALQAPEHRHRTTRTTVGTFALLWTSVGSILGGCFCFVIWIWKKHMRKLWWNSYEAIIDVLFWY